MSPTCLVLPGSGRLNEGIPATESGVLMRSLASRLTGVAVAAGVVLGVAALPAEAKSRPAHQLTAVATGPTDAPSGQTTVAAPLPAAATTFGSGVGGWVAGRMSLAWTKAVGHTAPGAL